MRYVGWHHIRGIVVAFLLIGCLATMIVPVGAMAPLLVLPNNTSAQQLGGAYNAYTFTSGDDTFEVFTVLPLTVQDVVYPIEFWYSCWQLAWGCLILGILMTVFRDRVPSIAIVAFGCLAFGGFLICALMLPYTAQMYVYDQVLQNVNAAGVPIGNNSIYVIQVADYRASPVHANICWGLSIAALIEMILGTLSFFGYLHGKGLKDASEGNYIESDIEGGGQDPNTLQYKRSGTGKAKR